MKEKILVSACLLGTPCRYDGASKPSKEILRLREKYTLIPFCPEEAGGLTTPRLPAERRGDRVIRKDGIDVSKAYRKGAELALKKCLEEGCYFAVLKEKSPSCGKNFRYDGNFCGKLIEGQGVTAEILMGNGITVYSEMDF
jgi:uncharacterized protein YbbK (DUF523 family)